MKDSDSNDAAGAGPSGTAASGRTRWRRFAVVALPAAVLGAGLLAGVANGAVPVQMNVSGQSFKVSADTLEGGAFSQYGGVVTKKDGGAIPVLASAIDQATLKNLCQSVKVPGTSFSMIIRAGKGNDSVTASGLLIGMDKLGGNAEFTNINIGQDASTVVTKDKGDAGTFAQQADKIKITNLKQRAYSTHAGTFTLNGLSLSLSLSGEECFPDSALPQ